MTVHVVKGASHQVLWDRPNHSLALITEFARWSTDRRRL